MVGENIFEIKACVKRIVLTSGCIRELDAQSVCKDDLSIVVLAPEDRQACQQRSYVGICLQRGRWGCSLSDLVLVMSK